MNGRALVLLVATLASGCVGTASTAPDGQPAKPKQPTLAADTRTWGAAGVRVERIVDKKYGVVCWVAGGRYEGAISCLKVTP